MTCKSQETDHSFILCFYQSFHASLIGEDQLNVLVGSPPVVMNLPEVEHIGLQVFQGTLQVPHGPVISTVVGLGGQKDLAAAGLHHFAHMPFTGPPQVIPLTAVPIHAIPGRGIDIVNAQINTFVDNFDGLLLHSHLFHGGLGPQAIYAHAFPGSAKRPLGDF